MRYYMGIDGGGTKTAYLLTDETGKSLSMLETRGCSHKEYGVKAVSAQIKSDAARCMEEAGICPEQLFGAALGLPCFGESKEADRLMTEQIRAGFPETMLYITNDVEVGWAGSLGLNPGINIVAGTGSIAFGKNSQGISARAGGWSTFFGDEGSCYWLGRRTMELFTKQADGRDEKGPLYSLVMERFSLNDDMDFVDIMEQEYMPNRERVASVQRLLLDAAKLGDLSAAALYREAGHELGRMICAVGERIGLRDEKLFVSYSGGLFHAGEYVLPALRESISNMDTHFMQPALSPVQGAVLLAASEAGGMDLEAQKAAMKNVSLK